MCYQIVSFNEQAGSSDEWSLWSVKQYGKESIDTCNLSASVFHYLLTIWQKNTLTSTCCQIGSVIVAWRKWKRGGLSFLIGLENNLICIGTQNYRLYFTFPKGFFTIMSGRKILTIILFKWRIMNSGRLSFNIDLHQL